MEHSIFKHHGGAKVYSAEVVDVHPTMWNAFRRQNPYLHHEMPDGLQAMVITLYPNAPNEAAFIRKHGNKREVKMHMMVKPREWVPSVESALRNPNNLTDEIRRIVGNNPILAIEAPSTAEKYRGINLEVQYLHDPIGTIHDLNYVEGSGGRPEHTFMPALVGGQVENAVRVALAFGNFELKINKRLKKESLKLMKERLIITPSIQ